MSVVFQSLIYCCCQFGSAYSLLSPGVLSSDYKILSYHNLDPSSAIRLVLLSILKSQPRISASELSISRLCMVDAGNCKTKDFSIFDNNADVFI